jgi:hypothetical protein
MSPMMTIRLLFCHVIVIPVEFFAESSSSCQGSYSRAVWSHRNIPELYACPNAGKKYQRYLKCDVEYGMVLTSMS